MHRYQQLFFISILLLASLPGGAAAFDAIVLIEGATQGVIEGESTREGREGSIPLLSFGASLIIPLDTQSGQPSGKRYSPITFAKIFDKASPKLYQACATGERLSKVEFKFFRRAESGLDELYMTYELTDAIVTAINAGGVAGPETTTESISVEFRRIRIAVAGGTEFEDDTRLP